ncbi:hypothetical protein FA15DRAFT_663061 [Coprinopsis marcescibilis]|uniref:Uncharacterized protein n=1 Tax=Coprinopsis marcescibilis TaxID=230819 RepID=A0A5C3LBJ9_COPMA|nr:hypothetical protein FA15DRAFT_663061 [Coprinopsis marcescibilis]
MPSHADLPVLVAPRPVRISSAFAFARPTRLPFRSDSDNYADIPSKSPSPLSGRSSTLPSEALEEFLAILKPSFFPSTSPTFGKACRSLTIPAFHQYERPLALRSRQRFDNHPYMRSENTDIADIPSTTLDSLPGEQQDSFLEQHDQDGPANRWLRFGPLSSPVSRIHTRNPFLKQFHDQHTIRALSPAAIPLPTPTPDEFMFLEEL